MAITPAEVSLGAKIWGWVKSVIAVGKRFAELEARVTALELALKTAPADACPYCGERAMRLKEQGYLLGDPGKQWTEEIWNCASCGKDYAERQKLKA
jgi:DNA-directed RNA polymerase subunit RPC12/RpoP